jgi:hypothetical protein
MRTKEHLPVSLMNDPAGQENTPAILKPTFDPVRIGGTSPMKALYLRLWSF